MKKSDNKQDDAYLDNVKVPAFRGKKIIATTITSVKLVIKKLLIVSINKI